MSRKTREASGEEARRRELSKDTSRAIQAMTRIALRQLASRPRMPDYDIVGRNVDKEYPSGDHIKYSVRESEIVPISYETPVIEGLSNVELERLYTEVNTVRLLLRHATVLHLPDLPLDRSVYVRLRRPPTEDKPEGGHWRDSRRFGISTRGYAYASHAIETPAVHLAAATLVGQAVNQSQQLNVPLSEASSLYASWQELDLMTPQPIEGQPIWSIFDTEN